MENSWYSLLAPPFSEQPELISANLLSGDTVCLSDKQVLANRILGRKRLSTGVGDKAVEIHEEILLPVGCICARRSSRGVA